MREVIITYKVISINIFAEHTIIGGIGVTSYKRKTAAMLSIVEINVNVETICQSVSGAVKNHVKAVELAKVTFKLMRNYHFCLSHVVCKRLTISYLSVYCDSYFKRQLSI